MKHNEPIKIDISPVYELLINIHAEVSVILDTQALILSKLEHRDEDEILKELHHNTELRFKSILEILKGHQDFDDHLRNLLSKI